MKHVNALFSNQKDWDKINFYFADDWSYSFITLMSFIIMLVHHPCDFNRNPSPVKIAIAWNLCLLKLMLSENFTFF